MLNTLIGQIKLNITIAAFLIWILSTLRQLIFVDGCITKANSAECEKMSGRIPQSVIEQIRAANDITEVIGSYIPLKQAGGNSLALCPFHKENTPSFTVNPQRQIYHCFGCHAHGDVFKFLQEYEQLEFIEAVKRLAERGGIPLEFEENPQAERSRRKKDLVLHIHSELAKRWHEVLMNEEAGKPARDYLCLLYTSPSPRDQRGSRLAAWA